MNLGASSGAEGWKDVLQLLREQSKKMEKLARALSVIQQGMQGRLFLLAIFRKKSRL